MGNEDIALKIKEGKIDCEIADNIVNNNEEYKFCKVPYRDKNGNVICGGSDIGDKKYTCQQLDKLYFINKEKKTKYQTVLFD